jgi:DNA-binding NarL/FixJ family response regulator
MSARVDIDHGLPSLRAIGWGASWPKEHSVPDWTDAGLTKEEREVVALAAEGLTSRAIAEALHLSMGQVRWRLRSGFEKLHRNPPRPEPPASKA